MSDDTQTLVLTVYPDGSGRVHIAIDHDITLLRSQVSAAKDLLDRLVPEYLKTKGATL